MSSASRTAHDAAHQAEQIAALEREIADLHLRLALSAQTTDHLAITRSDDPEARYQALIELSPQVVWMTDAQGGNIYCNRHWYEFSGLAPQETIGWGWVNAVHPDEVTRATRAWRAAVNRGVEYELETRFRRASDGQYRWHLCRGVPLKDVSGKVLKWLGIAIDIHDRKVARAAIDEANERMVMALEAAEAGTWDYYPQAERVECSPRCLAIFGAPQAMEVSIEHFIQAIHLQDRDRILALIRDAMDPAVAGDYDMDYRIVWPGGTVRWIFAKGKCFFSGEGPERKPVRISGMVVDITERKEAERDRAALVAALQNSPDFVGTTDLKGRVLFLNRAAMQGVGLRDMAEARSKTAFDFLFEEERRLLTETILPLVRTGQVWQGEFRMRHFATGEPILVETRIFGIRDETGKLTSMANISQDISGKKELEEQLRRAQKIEAVGRLAGGIAHDFNNLLTVIRGAAEVLQDSLPERDPKSVILKEISDAAERASSLTEQLLAFGKRQMVRPRSIDLNRVIRGMQGMLKRLAGEDIVLETELNDSLAHVKIDPIQVDQILINLTANARDAMPRGGVIRIRTFNSSVAPATINPPDSQAAQFACLSFSDNGRGMDKETLNHIFEPFFTTKEPGKGTGLGLSTVYGIIHQSGGEIAVESSPGQGALFTLFLPGITGELAPVVETPHLNALPGHGTVLLVEDEDSLRAIVADYLGDHGYTVYEAADAQEALKLAQAYDIDLLLTDIVMPETTGVDLASALVTVRPGIRVVFMSGYADHAAFQEAVNQPSTVFLQKPFRLSTLVAKIQEALAGAGTK